MKADYLTLFDGRKVRILFNMNALCEVKKTTGIEMSDLASGKADVALLRTIAWCSAVEGEKKDGRDLNLNEEEFGRMVSMKGIVEFSAILTEQSSGAEQKKNQVKGKLPRIFFRSRV